MSTDSEICARCGQPVPDVTDNSYSSWEWFEEGAVCPGCVTEEELLVLAEDYMELGESLARCARCRQPRPEDADPEDVGWRLFNSGELVCPSCTTIEDRQRGIREDQEAIAKMTQQPDDRASDSS